ncbi:MAG TPA: radical SAM protein [Vicinamibacterales bacterium]|nr:radical SAM protein [Vicinamibacterales bacterium]
MIVLVNPASTHSPRKPLPMSVLAVASVLDGEFDYAIVDANVDGDALACITALAERTALTAIAITVMPGPQLCQAVPLSRALKQRFPGVPLVWGGYFPSEHADVVLRDAAIDYCIRGQGERSFVSLARILAHGGGLDTVAGLSYVQNGRVRHNPAAPLAALDELPRWPYERLDMGHYFHRHYLGARVGAHHSSYGCPHACNFCAVVGIANRRWVAESPERVEGVLRHFKSTYAADAVQFHDMDFFISEPRTAAICERVKPLGLTWWALGRVDELMRYKTATWQVMKQSGLKMVFCGAESASNDTLAQMNKGGTSTAEQTLELALRMREFDVVPEFSFVVGNPPDPDEDLRRTLEFIRQIKAANEAAEIILYVYSPVRGSSSPEKFPFPETLDEWVSERWQSFALRRDPQTPWAPRSIRQRVRNFETVLNAYYPTVTDTRLTSRRRKMLRALASWRYHGRIEATPFELNAVQRVFRYQRPETTGF